jgi:hypothetical protein
MPSYSEAKYTASIILPGSFEAIVMTVHHNTPVSPD